MVMEKSVLFVQLFRFTMSQLWGAKIMEKVMRCLFALVLVYLIVQPVFAADYDKKAIEAAKQGVAPAQ